MNVRGTRGHRPGSSVAGSASQKQALSSAYASLANELTRKELRSIGGYSLGRTIGTGAFGTVKLGVHRLTNTRVAVKVVPKSLQSSSSDPSSPLSLLTRELHHHRRLRHQHILALYEIIATESSIYLVSELCTGGELFDYLVERGRLSLGETRRIFGQLVLGVAHLHQSGVVHRDLKLENVLLDERVNVKIADLGFGREFEKGRWMETWVGTLGYCAPEVVAAKRYLGEEVDIWSLGVILYTLLTGSLPFDDDDEGVMKEMILRCEYDIPSWLDDDAADLIRSILVIDPLMRLPLRSILAHPFFTRPSQEDYSTHQRNASPQVTRDAFPPAIPEEGSMSDSPSAEQSTFFGAGSPASTSTARLPPPFLPPPVPSISSHALDPSHVTDATYHTAASNEAGATVPVRPAEGADVPGRRTSEGDLTESKQVDDGGQHLNGSQASQAEDRGESALSTSNSEEKLAPPSPALSSLVAPPLQRNMSNSSSAASIISVGGSPVPHTRTPSRTKRRSVGSTFSERLFSLDEEHAADHVDYLALLSTPAPAPLSTPLEQALLDSLTTLGFDTGQIVHSITTDACDASGAVWWMLKRKADERERERREAELHQSPSVSRQSSLKRTAPVIEEQAIARAPSPPQPPPPPVPLATPVKQVPSLAGSMPRERQLSASGPLTPGARSEGPLTPTVEERLQYFLHSQPLSSSSGPLLEYFPPALNSPSRKSTQRSPPPKDQLSVHSSPKSQNSPSLHGGSLPSTSPDVVDSKGKRGRAGSVSMLARATSALGSSLAIKKPSEEEGPDGRSSPARGSIFTRKSSIPDLEQPRRASVPNDQYPRSTPPTSPERVRTNPLEASPITPARTLPPAPPVVEHHSPSISASASTNTFDTVTTTSSRKVSTQSIAPAKKGSKLLSNLKMWFVTDHRKRAGKTARSPSFGSMSGAGETRSLSRSGSLGSRQMRDATYAASPLTRPPIGSRRSSTASLVPLSRHSSMNSNSARPKLGGEAGRSHSHRRRRSDASSDREPSRPPSVRSFSASADGTASGRRQPYHRHSKAASSSSAGSYYPTANSSPKDAISPGTYRRPPTSTTVRRRHGSSASTRGASHSHSRQRSTSSSIATRHSSSSSAGEEEVLADEHLMGVGAEAITEEDETGGDSASGGATEIIEQGEWESSATKEAKEKEAARQLALRSLSGNLPSAQHQSHPHKSGSRVSLTSMASSHSQSRSQHGHGAVLFTAHKEHHLFGTPSQPAPPLLSHHSSHSSHSQRKPAPRRALRDVFSTSASTSPGDEDWVDDAGEDLENFCGGLGQGSSASAAVSSRTSTDSRMPDSPVAAAGAGGANQTGLFEGQTGRRAFRAPVDAVMEEEEEEEE